MPVIIATTAASEELSVLFKRSPQGDGVTTVSVIVQEVVDVNVFGSPTFTFFLTTTERKDQTIPIGTRVTFLSIFFCGRNGL